MGTVGPEKGTLLYATFGQSGEDASACAVPSEELIRGTDAIVGVDALGEGASTEGTATDVEGEAHQSVVLALCEANARGEASLYSQPCVGGVGSEPCITLTGLGDVTKAHVTRAPGADSSHPNRVEVGHWLGTLKALDEAHPEKTQGEQPNCDPTLRGLHGTGPRHGGQPSP